MSHFTTPLGEVFIVADGMGGHQGGRRRVAMTIEGSDFPFGSQAQTNAHLKGLEKTQAVMIQTCCTDYQK